MDHNNRQIPNCNMLNELDEPVYIREPEEFNDSVKLLKNTKLYAISTVGIFVMFFLIFSLNFGIAGWNAGNILTFVLVVVTLFFSLYYVVNWTELRTLLNKIKSDGTPCLKENILHCRK